jgi:type I restriction enzyme M protein
LGREEISDFSVAVSYEQIKEKNYSFSAGQYFEIKIQHEEMTPAEFDARITKHTAELTKLFAESRQLESQIEENLGKIAK